MNGNSEQVAAKIESGGKANPRSDGYEQQRCDGDRKETNMQGRHSRWIAGGLTLLLASTLVGTVPAEAGEADGFLYGRILTTAGDSYEGLLRWGTEESFWDDLFQSAKQELPAFDHVPKSDRKERKGRIEMFGFKMEWNDDKGGSRQFATRFGDIEKIVVTGKEDAIVYMKGGSKYEVSGYANDVGNAITVWDGSVGKIDLHWRRIDTIEFRPTPSSVEPVGTRVHGTIETDAGKFAGFIQWDKQECLSTDTLKGESRDGDLEIEFGKIRSIERIGGHSRVELLDGRTFDLDGSRDFDDSNRGILVEDERYGKVEVNWDGFDKVVFDQSTGSGLGYSAYRGGGPIEATVYSGREGMRGTIFFDLDEHEGWEFLNGSYGDVEFNIPFNLVAEIEPQGSSRCRVRLVNGETLPLSDGQDVSDSNDGILVLVGGSDENAEYIPWEEVTRIEVHH